MKYYFITFSAENRKNGGTSMWNVCIPVSPLRFITDVGEGDEQWYNFVIVNVFEISKEEFDEYKDNFG